MASRKPAVASRAVRAPLRSMMALVTSVVPWITWAAWAAVMPARSSASASAVSTAREGSSGVVSALATVNSPPPSETRIRSVKVPPMSTPTRYNLARGQVRVLGEREDVHLRGALLREQPAVGHQHGAVDVGGVVTGQEGRRPGQVFGLSDPAQGNGLAAAGLGLRVHALGVDGAGDQSADAHAVGPEVERHASDHGLDAALGGVVGDVAAVGLGGAARGQADDHARALARHDPRRAQAAVEDAAQVDLDDLPPPGVIGFQEVALGVDQAGVVDEHVDRAVAILDRPEE